MAVSYQIPTTSSTMPGLGGLEDSGGMDSSQSLMATPSASIFAQPFYLRPAYRFKTVTVLKKNFDFKFDFCFV